MSINWKDEYFQSKNRLVLTNEQVRIPGLRVFAHHNMPKAIPPLENHFHENAFEMVFVVKGAVIFYVNDKEYKMHSGDIFVTFPNEVHSTNGIPLSVGEIYWLQLDVSDPDHFLFLKNDVALTLIKKIYSIDTHNVHSDNKEIARCIKKAFSCVLIPGNEMMAASYITLFLHLLLECSAQMKLSLSPDIENSLTYILDNLTSVISLDELAERSHLSTSHFKAKFKEQIGTSPRNYINQEKIEYAKQLLLENHSITDISMSLGFSSSSYFAYTFKKYTSFTPSEFIKDHTTITT